MYVDSLSPELWNEFTTILTSTVPPTVKKLRKVKYPDHGFQRDEYQEVIAWTSGYLPKLASLFWNFKKWIDPVSFYKYRAFIKTLKLVYNNWTQLVRVEFTYETWAWYEESQCWHYV